MHRTLLAAVRRRLAGEGGFTLAELIVVLAILGTIMGAMTQLFVSATNAQIKINNRFNAQQNARLALDALRREIHCADSVAPTTGFPLSNINITLGSFCPTNSVTPSTGYVVWCTRSLTPSGGLSSTTTSRNGLYRYISSSSSFTVPASQCGSPVGSPAVVPVQKADYLTNGNVFTSYNYPGTGGGVRATLSIDLPVLLAKAPASDKYELTDDIVLRNTSR